MPASSALAANLTQPSMSGSAAGEVLRVVSTREVSCAVFIPTSPPFGNIQWKLSLVSINFRARPSVVQTAALLLPYERQNLPAESLGLVNLRPARDDELADAYSLVLDEGFGQLLGRPKQRRPDGAVVGHEPRPQRT